MQKAILVIGLLLAGCNVDAAELGVSAAKHAFGVHITSDMATSGVQFKADGLQHHDKYYLAGEIGYGFAEGAWQVAPHLSAFYLDLHDDTSYSYGVAAGLRLSWQAPLPQATHLYLDYSLSPDDVNRRLHQLHQTEVGIHYQPVAWLTLASGYRYLSMAKYGQTSHTLTDGAFIRVAWHF